MRFLRGSPLSRDGRERRPPLSVSGRKKPYPDFREKKIIFFVHAAEVDGMYRVPANEVDGSAVAFGPLMADHLRITSDSAQRMSMSKKA